MNLSPISSLRPPYPATAPKSAPYQPNKARLDRSGHRGTNGTPRTTTTGRLLTCPPRDRLQARQSTRAALLSVEHSQHAGAPPGSRPKRRSPPPLQPPPRAPGRGRSSNRTRWVATAATVVVLLHNIVWPMITRIALCHNVCHWERRGRRGVVVRVRKTRPPT